MKAIFLFAFLTASCIAYAQPHKVFIETALRFTGDAEMAFIGPSFSVGPGIQLGKQFSVSSNYTFFRSSYTDDGQKATFQTNTIDLVTQYQFHQIFHPNRGFYVGAGLAWQTRKQTPENITQRTSYWTGAYTVGYRFPVKINKLERSLSVDVKGIGPYTEKDGVNLYTEVLTQFMIGLKLRL